MKQKPYVPKIKRLVAGQAVVHTPLILAPEGQKYPISEFEASLSTEFQDRSKAIQRNSCLWNLKKRKKKTKRG